MNATNYCPTCGRSVTGIEPLEPLYSVEDAAGLVPTTKASLLRLLQRQKHELPEPWYRIWHRRRYRLISLTEVRWARNRLLYRGKRRRMTNNAETKSELITDAAPVLANANR